MSFLKKIKLETLESILWALIVSIVILLAANDFVHALDYELGQQAYQAAQAQQQVELYMPTIKSIVNR